MTLPQTHLLGGLMKCEKRPTSVPSPIRDISLSWPPAFGPFGVTLRHEDRKEFLRQVLVQKISNRQVLIQLNADSLGPGTTPDDAF